MFWDSWDKSFTNQNIISAFQATGIFLYNPNKLLTIIDYKPTTPIKSFTKASEKTPLSTWAFHHTFWQHKKQPSPKLWDQIAHGNERAAAMHKITQYELKGLTEAFQLEKKKAKHGKHLNLLGKEDSGPQLFSPFWIIAARTFLAAKEKAEQ